MRTETKMEFGLAVITLGLMMVALQPLL